MALLQIKAKQATKSNYKDCLGINSTFKCLDSQVYWNEYSKWSTESRRSHSNAFIFVLFFLLSRRVQNHIIESHEGLSPNYFFFLCYADGQVIYQPTRPPMHRSGSVPSGHTHSMDASDHYVSSGHSDTYPYHCPNVGDGPVIVHSNDR